MSEREPATMSPGIFWGLIGALIFFLSSTMFLIGYKTGEGDRAMELWGARSAARKELLTEPGPLSKTFTLVTSGVDFCYNNGNIYTVEKVPLKNKSLMPWFKTVRMDEF